MRALFIYALFLCVFQAKCQDYYWRDFNGTIPNDALEVDFGVYIGLTTVQQNGMCVGSISADQTVMRVYCFTDNAQNETSLIKVMCTSRPADFSWLRTSGASFAQDTAGRTLVMAGFLRNENFNGEFYIGRARDDGFTIPGNVVPGYPMTDHSVPIQYVSNNNEYTTETNSYEVLIYIG